LWRTHSGVLIRKLNVKWVIGPRKTELILGGGGKKGQKLSIVFQKSEGYIISMKRDQLTIYKNNETKKGPACGGLFRGVHTRGKKGKKSNAIGRRKKQRNGELKSYVLKEPR